MDLGQKIMSIIAAKQDEALQNSSIDDFMRFILSGADDFTANDPLFLFSFRKTFDRIFLLRV